MRNRSKTTAIHSRDPLAAPEIAEGGQRDETDDGESDQGAAVRKGQPGQADHDERVHRRHRVQGGTAEPLRQPEYDHGPPSRQPPALQHGARHDQTLGGRGRKHTAEPEENQREAKRRQLAGVGVGPGEVPQVKAEYDVDRQFAGARRHDPSAVDVVEKMKGPGEAAGRRKGDEQRPGPDRQTESDLCEHAAFPATENGVFHNPSGYLGKVRISVADLYALEAACRLIDTNDLMHRARIRTGAPARGGGA